MFYEVAVKTTKKSAQIFKITLTAAIAAIFLLAVMGCSSDPTDSTGTSVSGYTIAMRANPGEVRANGSDTALIVVEVWDRNGNFVDGETVTFSVTLGNLASDTATTSSGVAVNTFTSSSSEGMAIVTAAVENIVSKVEIVQYYTTR
jgi:hypothetical protein